MISTPKCFVLFFLFAFLFIPRIGWGQVSANFTVSSPGDSCKSRTVQLSASSSIGTISSYQWQFRNKTTGESLGAGNGINITRNFLNPGVYEITLTVSDGINTSVKTTDVSVYKMPEIDFSVDFSEGCPPLLVKLTDSSTPGDGEITRWEWSYNDGTKDVFTDLRSPTHNYANQGNYFPTLIATNSFGCTASRSLPNPIRVYPKITPVIWTENNYNCEAPHTVTFRNMSPETSNFNFRWSFGDGTSEPNNADVLTHVYANSGVYRASLQAINAAENCSTTVSTSGNSDIYIGRPDAAISVPENVCVGSTITLRSAADATGISNQGRWFFEEGTASVLGKNISRTFNTQGTWKIKYVNFNTLSGCYSDTAEAEINVLPTPTANFTLDKTNGCQRPHTVTFTNTSLNASGFTWAFGDGATLATTDLSEVSHSYTNFGTYAVRLTATNEAGCSDVKNHYYVRNTAPSVTMLLGSKEGCAPFSVSVRATGTAIDPIQHYEYDYGDGTIETRSVNQSSHTFPTAGQYSIRVKMITAQGCEAISEAQEVTVNEFCDDDGSGAGGGGGGGGGGPLSVGRSGDCNDKYTFTFRDTTQNAEMISWNFDGVLNTTNENPITHTFPADGVKKRFMVTTTLRDLTTSAVVEHKVRVVAVDEKAAFEMDRTDICKGLGVKFTTLGIDSSNIANYTWDFGDGTDRLLINNTLNFTRFGTYLLGNTNHIYTDTGVFFPKLIIVDKFGCKDSIQYPTPIVVKGPEARFTVDTSSFCRRNFSVLFSDSSKANGATPITEWRWVFGDGSSQVLTEGGNISHSYNQTSYHRKYEPTLTVTDALGCSDSYKLPVTSYYPRANFTTNDTLRCGLFNIRFFNSSNALVSNPNQYVWKYGDGLVSTGFAGSHNHMYADTGKFTVTLVVTDDGGCVDSLTRHSYVKLVRPVADFSVGSDTSKCVGTFSLPFVSTSTYSNSYVWDFGDSETSSTTNIEVSHFYKEAGEYDVRLIVTGLNGCKDTVSKPIRIKGPVGKLFVADNYLCVGEPLVTYVVGSNIAGYFWDFNDLSSTSGLSNNDSVNHYYQQPGKYLPNLILVSPEACQITLSAADSIVVDSISAGPDANIECGDSHTSLRGLSVLGLDDNYFWQGSAGVDYQPDHESLLVDVNVTGEYILKAKDGRCSMTDTVVVTTSGIVPTADAGVDKKLDCITGKALLEGSTTTADTRMKWQGPVGQNIVPNDSSATVQVSTAGEYILTVTQKFCTMTDTVQVLECSLNATDTLFQICADVAGTPATFTNYNLTTFNTHVVGGVLSSVEWFSDSNFINLVSNTTMLTLEDNTVYYAQITSIDGTEIARARAEIVVHDYVEVDFDPISNTCEASDTLIITGMFPVGGVFSGVGTTPEGLFIPPAFEGVYPVQYEYISQDGCRDTLVRMATVIDVPDAPTVADTVRYCQTVDVLPDFLVTSDVDNTVLWYNEDTLTMPEIPSLFRKVTTEYYFVTQKNILCESDFSRITVVVDTTPEPPYVLPLDAVCEGFGRTVHTSGFANSTFSWTIDNNITTLTQNTQEDSVSFVAGTTTVTGTVVETTVEGCASEVFLFTIPVDLHPTQASVSGGVEDTIVYCVTNNQKVMTGNAPLIGIGGWNIIKNTNLATIDLENPESAINNFLTTSDTLVAEWITKNGVCPETKATLTIVPEEAFYPEVHLSEMTAVCEQTAVQFVAQPGFASGDAPQYFFYNSSNQLLNSDSQFPIVDILATTDTLVYVKMLSNYGCLYADTATSSLVFLDVVAKPLAQLLATSDTICETDGPITLYPAGNKEKTVYQWTYKGELLYLGEFPHSFNLSFPQESGKYVLKASNDYCLPAFDSMEVKIYEQVRATFPNEIIDVTYSPRNHVLLPLEVDELQYDSVSNIMWDNDLYLGRYTINPRYFVEYIRDTSIQQPYYIAQNENLTTTYTATVYTGLLGKGCEAAATITIQNYMPVNVPNAFSPNDDGLNDTWVIRGLPKYPNTQVKVFNRWGNILFEDHHGYQTPWNGTSNGVKVPFGTYYYVIEFLGSSDNSDFSDSGWLLVIE